MLYGGKNVERKKMKENTKSHTRNMGRLRSKTGNPRMSGSVVGGLSVTTRPPNPFLPACSVRNINTQGQTGGRWCEFHAGAWAAGRAVSLWPLGEINARMRSGSGGLRTEGSKGRGPLAKLWRVLALTPQDGEPGKKTGGPLLCVCVLAASQKETFQKGWGSCPMLLRSQNKVGTENSIMKVLVIQPGDTKVYTRRAQNG